MKVKVTLFDNDMELLYKNIFDTIPDAVAFVKFVLKYCDEVLDWNVEVAE